MVKDLERERWKVCLIGLYLVISDYCLLFQLMAKLLGEEGSIQPFSHMGYSRTVSERFYGPDCSVDEGNEELG